ncbi:protease complex subunit PrcB family protein [Blautia liquoris]|uniref:Protease complex subunit PrcB family protein n=1 Tax=Blautia liquoris TaxID=2779518 RepID=A0A7M2RJF7_9FIRM|nr:protease complex subunit PrcB family protein [Blautia liquoris]QOV19687.1 protease complex subunit PrcB family protein [Blautia liquoris]
MKKIAYLLICALFVAAAISCSPKKNDGDEYKACDFTVLKTGEIPDEVSQLIEKQGDEAFQMVYRSDGWLFCMRGYGKQKTGGYSIRILDVGIRGEMLRIKSELLGPQTKEEQKGVGSRPYFVLKLEDPGYPVMFEESGGEMNGINEEKSASDLQKK